MPDLIFCAHGGPAFARIAVECGWLYGARLPATVYESVYFADQDWRKPDRKAYMTALEKHRPAVATVLDWEHESQWPEVLAWATEAAALVTAAVVVIPKVPGRVAEIPDEIGGRPVVLGYSVPTSYGGSPCGLWEFGRRPVHLLGGSPQKQMDIARYVNVVSADGNMAGQQARQGRFWSPTKTAKGRWSQLSSVGDSRVRPAEECFRRSMVNVKGAWGGHG